jgi:hypothetical protein
MIEFSNGWVAVVLSDDGNIDGVYGPYDAKGEAVEFVDQFNQEYDGSPWRAVMRGISRLRIGTKVLP